MVGKEVAQVGIWGTKAKGSARNDWSFLLKKGHKLRIITIGHDECVRSLMFTSEDIMGRLYTSKKVGGWNHEAPTMQIVLEPGERMIGINGTIGIQNLSYSYKVISSLSFVTNKWTHGPIGQETGSPFSVPWDEGKFAGFYGLAGSSIYGIGVYLKARDEIARVGLWGTTEGDPEDHWSFRLGENYKLKKISICHRELIYNISFISESNTSLVPTLNKFGGSDNEGRVSQITFGNYEELVGIEGTFEESEDSYGAYANISSLSFVTTKMTYGPYGLAKGTSFSVPWKAGGFAGFYGIANGIIDGIGVYLKATI